MAKIGSMFSEVRYELMKVVLLNLVLETAVVFLCAHLILSVFSMGIGYSIVVAIVYFGIRFWFESQEFDLKRIEEKNPEMREMLRTANDNQTEDTLMAHALFQEVMTKIRNVSGGSFLEMNLILRRLGAILILAMVLVALAFFNVDIAKFDNPFEGTSSYLTGLFKGDEQEQQEIDLGDDSLYGEASMADLSEDELQLEIKQSLNEIDFSQQEDLEEYSDTIKDFPGEAEAVSDESYAAGLEELADRKTAAEYAQQIKS